MFRCFYSCLLISYLTWGLAPMQASIFDDCADQNVDHRISAIFKSIGLKATNEIPWVRVECGPAGSELRHEGWLLRDDSESVIVYERSGAILAFRRPEPGEVRPPLAIGELPWLHGWKLEASGIAWAVKPADFDTFCRAFLKKGLSERSKFGPFNQVNSSNSVMINGELQNVLVTGCLLGFAADQVGQKELSKSLFKLASNAHDNLSMFPLGRPRDFAQHCVNRAIDKMCVSAINAANYGVPRPQLLETWQIIAQLPDESLSAEAKNLVVGYKSLIEEDCKWQEPKWLASLSKKEKADYWMYRLRDLDDSMFFGSGVSSGTIPPCRVLVEGFMPQTPKPKPNPAIQLRKLGMAALPVVIAHLDDTRPTRAGPMLRYGDCCQQIFEEITNHKIFESTLKEEYPVRAGKAKICKELAEKWWAGQSQPK
ncbi:hypothetical protein BH10PLA2_BH10PLA2_15190 [soil metagenome]